MLSTPLMFHEICKMFSGNLASSISINTSPVSNSCGPEKLSLITPLKKDRKKIKDMIIFFITRIPLPFLIYQLRPVFV